MTQSALLPQTPEGPRLPRQLTDLRHWVFRVRVCCAPVRARHSTEAQNTSHPGRLTRSRDQGKVETFNAPRACRSKGRELTHRLRKVTGLGCWEALSKYPDFLPWSSWLDQLNATGGCHRALKACCATRAALPSDPTQLGTGLCLLLLAWLPAVCQTQADRAPCVHLAQLGAADAQVDTPRPCSQGAPDVVTGEQVSERAVGARARCWEAWRWVPRRAQEHGGETPVGFRQTSGRWPGQQGPRPQGQRVKGSKGHWRLRAHHTIAQIGENIGPLHLGRSMSFTYS